MRYTPSVKKQILDQFELLRINSDFEDSRAMWEESILKKHSLSREEVEQWQRDYAEKGMLGLTTRSAKLQWGDSDA